MGAETIGGQCVNGHVVALKRGQAIEVYGLEYVRDVDRGVYLRTDKKVPAELCEFCRAEERPHRRAMPAL